MRWQQLFADLEGQLDEAERLEREAEIADRTQREQALVRFGDRVRAAVGHVVEVRLCGAGVLSGEVSAAGPDWMVLADAGTETLVRLGAVLTAHGIPDRGVTDESAVAARLGLGYAVRVLMRERADVAAVLVDGRYMEGTIGLVGADYFELAASPDGGPARGRRHRTLVMFTGFAALRRR